MGVRVKGDMYCPRCKQPVLAQRTGHGVRNTIAIGGVLSSLGLSLVVATVNTVSTPQQRTLNQAFPAERFWNAFPIPT